MEDESETPFQVIEGISSDEASMRVLRTPATQNYCFVEMKRYELKDYTYLHGYVRAAEVKLKKFPLDANPRLPVAGGVTKKMSATLVDTPQDFHHLNNGITVVAEAAELDPEENVVEMRFGSKAGESGYGICNGGHTYYAIETHAGTLHTDALVRIEILVLPKTMPEPERLKKIKKIAAARNNHAQLKTITEANYSGHYEPFKRVLGKHASEIRWREGDREARQKALPSDKFIALLASVSPLWYEHPLHEGGDASHQATARNFSSVHKKWLLAVQDGPDDRDLSDVRPLAVDLLRIRDMVAHSLKVDEFTKVASKFRSTTIFQSVYKANVSRNLSLGDPSARKGLDIPHPHMAMIIGSFRYNVWLADVEESGDTLVGWLEDPRDLWEKQRENLVSFFYSLVRGESKQKVSDSLARSPAAYTRQLSAISHGQEISEERWKKPSKFYRRSEDGTIDEFELCSTSEAEVFLTVRREEGDLVATLSETPGDLEYGYKTT